MPSPTAAQDAEIAETKGESFGSVTFRDQEFEIGEKPNPLLISELARTGSGAPEAIGVIADFFEVTLADYAAFKRAVYKAKPAASQEELSDLLSGVMEQTMGRPTE